MCWLCDVTNLLIQSKFDVAASEEFGTGGLSIAVLNAEVDELVLNNSPKNPTALKRSYDLTELLTEHEMAFPHV